MKIGPDDQMDEAISALIDGELDGESDRELRQQLIQRICTDQALKDRWTSYHLISDSLSNNLPSEICCDLSDRVSQLLENEATYSLSSAQLAAEAAQSAKVIDASKRFNRTPQVAASTLTHKQLLMKRAAGFAIAASVATVALVSYQIGLQQHLDENLVAQQSTQPSSQQAALSQQAAQLQQTAQAAIQQSEQAELASMNPTQMATVNGVTVLASPVNNPQYHLVPPANTAPGVYTPGGQYSNGDNSRFSIGYNFFEQQKNQAMRMDNSQANQVSSRSSTEAGNSLDERESALLRQYLMDHNQRYSSSRVQGVMPFARIMAVPTQPTNQQ